MTEAGVLKREVRNGLTEETALQSGGGEGES